MTISYLHTYFSDVIQAYTLKPFPLWWAPHFFSSNLDLYPEYLVALSISKMLGCLIGISKLTYTKLSLSQLTAAVFAISVSDSNSILSCSCQSALVLPLTPLSSPVHQITLISRLHSSIQNLLLDFTAAILAQARIIYLQDYWRNIPCSPPISLYSFKFSSAVIQSE